MTTPEHPTESVERALLETQALLHDAQWTRHGATCHRYGRPSKNNPAGYYEEEPCTCGYDALLAYLVAHPETRGARAALSSLDRAPSETEAPR